MADFDQLKQKYQPVLDVIRKDGAQIEALSLMQEEVCHCSIC